MTTNAVKAMICNWNPVSTGGSILTEKSQFETGNWEITDPIPGSSVICLKLGIWEITDVTPGP